MEDLTLPPHVEQTVRAVEQVHTEHHEGASPADRLLERSKARVGRPASVAVVLVVVLFWIASNVLLGLRIDPPPFLYLQLVLAVSAVCLTILILATQQRADQLASHREKLILQLGFVSEQKTTKIIALMEELRRDTPQVKDRTDTEAEQMTESVNVRAVSDALRDGGADPPETNGL
jgi:uncharacterized membrane protein